jgi:hypothetical protein
MNGACALPFTRAAVQLRPLCVHWPAPLSSSTRAGGQRSADCQLDLEVCYRNDGNPGQSNLLVAFNQIVPGRPTTQWLVSLNNGWCQYVKLYGANLTLSYAFSTDSGVTFTQSGSISVPSASSCSSTLQAPIISPIGGVYTGAVRVTLTSPSPGATIYYRLSGATYTGASAVVYTGPFNLVQVRACVCAGWGA